MEKHRQPTRSRDVQSSKWFIRLTLPHEILDEKKNQMLNWIDLYKCLGYKHTSVKEKEHVHAVIELTSLISKQALDLRLKKIWPVKGNDFSSVVWDGGDAACSYMFHEEGAPLWICKGFTEEDIKKYSKMNTEVQAVVAINKEKAPGRQVDKLVEKLRHYDAMPTGYEIGVEFIKLIRAGVMYEPGDFKLKNMIEEVKLKLCRTDEEVEVYAATRLNSILKTY
jgi:hypothetical protein